MHVPLHISTEHPEVHMYTRVLQLHFGQGEDLVVSGMLVTHRIIQLHSQERMPSMHPSQNVNFKKTPPSHKMQIGPLWKRSNHNSNAVRETHGMETSRSALSQSSRNPGTRDRFQGQMLESLRVSDFCAWLALPSRCNNESRVIRKTSGGVRST